MGSDWYLYIIRCSDDSLYTGITSQIDRRIEEHNRGNGKGSKYTSARRPVRLVYQESWRSRSEASAREHQIKQMSRQEKERLLLCSRR